MCSWGHSEHHQVSHLFLFTFRSCKVTSSRFLYTGEPEVFTMYSLACFYQTLLPIFHPMGLEIILTLDVTGCMEKKGLIAHGLFCLRGLSMEYKIRSSQSSPSSCSLANSIALSTSCSSSIIIFRALRLLPIRPSKDVRNSSFRMFS